MEVMSMIHENNDQINNSIDGMLEKQILEGVDSPDKQNKKSTFDSQDSILHGDALLAEVTAFVSAIINRTPPLVSGEDGLQALRTAIKITEIIAMSNAKAG